MTHGKKLLSAIGLGVFAVILTLSLSAYFSPAMLIELASLRLCS
ncbi:MAG TPA: hypothetical protein VK572_14800 [Burkholderiales bacterium]|nr:hypothetical protein [Burkholderiales bacterium]